LNHLFRQFCILIKCSLCGGFFHHGQYLLRFLLQTFASLTCIQHDLYDTEEKAHEQGSAHNGEKEFVGKSAVQFTLHGSLPSRVAVYYSRVIRKSINYNQSQSQRVAEGFYFYLSGGYVLKPCLYILFVVVSLGGGLSAQADEPVPDTKALQSTPQEAVVSPGGVSRPPVSSAAARKELQRLMDEGVKMLAQELVTEGTFYPFVTMIGHDNEVRLIGTPASLRVDSPDEAVQAMVQKARQLAKERRIRGAAFFMDYMATREDNGFSQAGIRVELNHIHPDALSVFIPYSVTDDKKLRLLTPQYKEGKNVVFDGQP